MKKLLLAMVMMVASASLKGETLSFLYWMIDTTEGSSDSYATDSTLVKVLAYGGGTSGDDYLTLYYGNGNMSTLSDPATIDYESATAGGVLGAALAGTGSSAWSYIVELWNDGVKVAQSDSITFTEAAAEKYISIVTTAGGFPFENIWMVGGFTPVPEPSSALLFLLGCAALCLRRQRGSEINDTV